jgi:hypothetical protein
MVRISVWSLSFLFLILGAIVAQNTPTNGDVAPKTHSAQAKPSTDAQPKKSVKKKATASHAKDPADIPIAVDASPAAAANSQTATPDDGSANSTPIKIGAPQKPTPPPHPPQ